MRKVNVLVEGVLTIQIPVRIDVLVRADEGADISSVVTKAIEDGKMNHPLADVEDIKLEGGVIPYNEEEGDLSTYLEECVSGDAPCEIRIDRMQVTDSR